MIINRDYRVNGRDITKAKDLKTGFLSPGNGSAYNAPCLWVLKQEDLFRKTVMTITFCWPAPLI